jgi:DNA repair protein RAD50
MTEREQQRNSLHSLEADLHQMQLRQNTLENEIRDKTALEEQVDGMKKEIITFTAKLKVLGMNIYF